MARVSAYCLSCIVFLLTFYLKLVLLKRDLYGGDITILSNSLWNTGAGRILYNEILYRDLGQVTFLNEHFSPTLLLLAPIYQIYPSPVVLIALQALAHSVTAILLFHLAVRVTKDKIAPLLISSAYLVFVFPLWAVVDRVYGFHHDCLIPPLFVAAVILYERGSWKWLLGTLGVLFGVKESVPLAFLFSGVILWVFKAPLPKKMVKIFKPVILMAFLFLFVGGIGVPLLTGVANRHMAFSAVHSDPPDVFAARAYWLCFPMAFFSFSPVLLLATPDLVMMLLTKISPYDWHCYFISAVFAVGVVYFPKKYRRVSQWGLIIVFIYGVAFLARIIPPVIPWVGISDSDITSVESVVPRGAVLSTSSTIGLRFANREHLVGPTHKKFADYVVVDVSGARAFAYDAELVQWAIAEVDGGRAVIAATVPVGAPDLKRRLIVIRRKE